MTTIHQLSCTLSPGGLLFACEHNDCGRRLIIDRDRVELAVIDHGDRGRSASWFRGRVEMWTVQVYPS
jgi:hypothetical protein